MKPSIKQISDITGFSAATVSNALNHKKGVNKETSEEIFRVAREIGYLDANTISKIKLLIFRKNGLIIDDTPFFTALIDGFEKECRESGYEMALGTVDQRQPDYEEQVRLAMQDPDTAVVLLGTELDKEDLELFSKAPCPLMLLDYWSHNMDFSAVVINNRDSMRKAVRYLASKGHSRIGYLRGDFRILGFRQRETGFREAMKEAGLTMEEGGAITLSTTMDGACRDLQQYLRRYQKQDQDQKQDHIQDQTHGKLPTAFVAENDMIALGAMRAFQAEGIRIPEDVSIIGFDDLPFCEISYPRLTSLRVEKQEMGALAVRRVIEIVKKAPRIHTKTEVCTEFIERDSVKDLRQ